MSIISVCELFVEMTKNESPGVVVYVHYKGKCDVKPEHYLKELCEIDASSPAFNFWAQTHVQQETAVILYANTPVMCSEWFVLSLIWTDVIKDEVQSSVPIFDLSNGILKTTNQCRNTVFKMDLT